MKTLRIAIFISLLVHLIMLLISTSITWQADSPQEVEIRFVAEPQEIPIVQAEEPETPPPVQPRVPESDELPADEVSPEPVPPATDIVQPDTADTFDVQDFFTQSPLLALKQPMGDINMDTGDTAADTRVSAQAPFFTPQESLQFKTQPGPFDKIQDGIDKRSTGTQAPLSLNQAIQEGAKYLTDVLNPDENDKPVRMDFIPSESELAVLRVLWEQPKVTDHEIYATIDTSVRITAEGLNGVLERLTDKGLLQRTMVSPRHEFTFPLGSVEMSAKNRRNRVYAYQSRIEAEEVLRYLNAVLYRVEHGAASADSSNARHSELTASLKQKILTLLE